MNAPENLSVLDAHQPLRFGLGDEAIDPLALALRRLRRATFIAEAAEDHFAALRGSEVKLDVVLEAFDLLSTELDEVYLALDELARRRK